jgi:hypothetical protein
MYKNVKKKIFNPKMATSLHRLFSLAAALISILLVVSLVYAQDKPEQNLDEKAKERMLKREAANSFWRLKRTLEREGFYSGRVALNVWRSAAIDAGTFDHEQYNEFKKQLYEKSINDSLKCFEEFILEEDYYNANVCLQTWRMHSKELGTYDQAQYESLKNELTDARTGKTTERKAPAEGQE